MINNHGWNWLKIIKWLKPAVFILFLSLLPGRVWAEANEADVPPVIPPFNYGIEVDYNSRYLWRGLAWSEGAVLQPTIWLSAADFTFELWGNYELTHKDPHTGQFSEVDLTLIYTRKFDKLTVEPKFSYWIYPNVESWPPTAELSLKFAYPVGAMNVFLYQTFDCVSYEGAFFTEAGLNYEKEFNPKLSMAAKLTAGWGSPRFNEVYLELSKPALNYTGLGLELTYYPTESFYLRPHLEISNIADSELRLQVDRPALVNFGLVAGKEF